MKALLCKSLDGPDSLEIAELAETMFGRDSIKSPYEVVRLVDDLHRSSMLRDLNFPDGWPPNTSDDRLP